MKDLMLAWWCQAAEWENGRSRSEERLLLGGGLRGYLREGFHLYEEYCSLSYYLLVAI